jgi:hypothetical protein
MSDQIERDIEEIMNRLGEPAPREGAHERVDRLVRGWSGGLRRALASRVPRISARQIKLASLALVVLVAAGLFLGLVYPGPLLAGGGSGDGEVQHGSVGDQIGGAAGVGDARQDSSVAEALGTDSAEGREEADHEPDEHEEGDRGRGEDHH